MVINGLVAAEAENFFRELDLAYRHGFWHRKLSDELAKKSYSDAQHLFIIESLEFLKKIDENELGSSEIQGALTDFELRAISLFGQDEAFRLFYTLSDSNPSETSALMSEKPPCDCDTSSYNRCLGCAQGYCYWTLRGCGFLKMSACNGICPSI